MEGEVTLKADWDLQYCSSGINKIKKAQWIICICVFTAMLMRAYTTQVLLQRQLVVTSSYYIWSHRSPVEILYWTSGLNSRIHWLQLISWYQWAWAFTTGILRESVLVFDPFHWNGIIIISIIINQNLHNNNNNNNNNNNIKNIQMMDTEVIQNTLR